MLNTFALGGGAGGQVEIAVAERHGSGRPVNATVSRTSDMKTSSLSSQMGLTETASKDRHASRREEWVATFRQQAKGVRGSPTETQKVLDHVRANPGN